MTQIVTSIEDQPAPAVQQCDMCPRTTASGCVRSLRVELIGDGHASLAVVPMLEWFFCSETCARNAAAVVMEEINTGTDDDLLPHLKSLWRGKVRSVFCLYTSVRRSAG
jgi:hypothetical protein